MLPPQHLEHFPNQSIFIFRRIPLLSLLHEETHDQTQFCFAKLFMHIFLNRTSAAPLPAPVNFHPTGGGKSYFLSEDRENPGLERQEREDNFGAPDSMERRTNTSPCCRVQSLESGRTRGNVFRKWKTMWRVAEIVVNFCKNCLEIPRFIFSIYSLEECLAERAPVPAEDEPLLRDPDLAF